MLVSVSVAITLDTERFTIEEENLKKEIQEKLDGKFRDIVLEFDVKLIIVINDAGELFSVWTNTSSVPQCKIVPVFIQFIVEGNKDTPIPGEPGEVGLIDDVKGSIKKHLEWNNRLTFAVIVDNNSISGYLKDYFSKL